MNKFFILVILSSTLLTACNTVAGLGSDITKSAQWTQNKMSGTDLSQGAK